MQLRKLFYLSLIIPMLFLTQACSDDDNGTDPVEINEAEVLAKYFEDDLNYTGTIPAMIKASDVNDKLLTSPATIYVIDIRSAADYGNGHIPGAVNVAAGDLLTHYESNNLSAKEVVVIACYSGQTAGWATGLMKLAGYSNVKDLKWGMCSWNPATSGSWTSTNNVGNTYAAQMTSDAASRNAAGELPAIDTGKETGPEIAAARIAEIFAEGFGSAKISKADVFANSTSNYIVNYWKSDHYAWGHIPGAVQYTPYSSGVASELNYSTSISTLPTDKPVVVYCYTGQTSAHMAAYLRVLGYDAKSLLFGMNGMSYDGMPGTKFVPDSEIHDYDLEN